MQERGRYGIQSQLYAQDMSDNPFTVLQCLLARSPSDDSHTARQIRYLLLLEPATQKRRRVQRVYHLSCKLVVGRSRSCEGGSMKRGGEKDEWGVIGKATPYICLLRSYEGETLPMICVRDERYTSSAILATHPTLLGICRVDHWQGPTS